MAILKRITVTYAAENAANLDPTNVTIPWDRSRRLRNSRVFEDLCQHEAQWLIMNLECPASMGAFHGTSDPVERGMQKAATACVKKAKSQYKETFGCEWVYPSVEDF